MISNRQRRRALARAKWQRQQAKRTAAQRRARMLGIIAGTAVAVVALVLLAWGVVVLVQRSNNSPGRTLPSTQFPSLQTPTASTPPTVSASPPSTSPHTTATTGTTSP